MVLILRATDEASADRMARQVAPKLARVLGVKGTAEPADDPSFTRLGRLRGRPLEIRRDGDRLAIGWGEGMLAASIGPNRDPSRMLGARLRSLGIDPADSCHHAAVVWPARLPAGWADPAQSTLALESLGPVTWVGRVGPSGAVDEFRALGLADSVRKFLDELPIAPEEQP
ncbi:MAG: hypothetical protein U0800_27645 [Isosphaeraceae bacterium]